MCDFIVQVHTLTNVCYVDRKSESYLEERAFISQ